MSSIQEKILALTRQLYPTGRAYKVPIESDLEKLHRAFAVDQEQAYNDATAILNSVLPDNLLFTEDDATDWERRLGMINSPLVLLEDRKLAIIRKLNAPGVNPAKGHYLYLQDQLQKAGFDVYVYENIFPDYPSGYITRTPYDVAFDVSPVDAATMLTDVQHGDVEHGEMQHGFYYNNMVANHIDETLDHSFDIGSNFRSTFFIGGDPIGSFANVDAMRKDEFRQLILKVKQPQNIGFLFIKYI